MDIDENKIELELPEIVSAIIDGYETQNSTVVCLIHSNILGGLSGLKLQATLLLGKSRMARKNRELLIRQIDQLSAELRTIHNEIYPKILHHVGLRKCLYACATEIEERYSVHIQHEDLTEPGQKLALSDSSQLNMLRLYKAILVRLVCEHGAQIIYSKLINDSESLKLEFEIKSHQNTVQPYSEIFLVESLDCILARVIGLDAEIDPKSDWDKYLGIVIGSNT